MESQRKSGQSKKRNRGLLSCTECHRRKQKCDRESPCGDCQERGLPDKCVYLKPANTNDTMSPDLAVTGKNAISRMRRIMTGEEVLLSTESVDDLRTLYSTAPGTVDVSYEYDNNQGSQPVWDIAHSSRRFASPSGSNRTTHTLTMRPKSPNVASGLRYNNLPVTIGGLDPFSVLPDTVGEPIPKELLIRYYLERLAPWLCYLDDLLPAEPDAPRIAWLPFAIEHTAFFYATLLVAAIHLNRRRKIRDPSALYWFKVQTIKHANMNMGDPEKAASDEMIMVALVLLFWNFDDVIDVSEYEIHMKGIHQMIKLRGGLANLGMRGMAKNWLNICWGPWRDGWEYGQFTYWNY